MVAGGWLRETAAGDDTVKNIPVTPRPLPLPAECARAHTHARKYIAVITFKPVDLRGFKLVTAELNSPFSLCGFQMNYVHQSSLTSDSGNLHRAS